MYKGMHVYKGMYMYKNMYKRLHMYKGRRPSAGGGPRKRARLSQYLSGRRQDDGRIKPTRRRPLGAPKGEAATCAISRRASANARGVWPGNRTHRA